MRVDDSTIYCLPTLKDCCKQCANATETSDIPSQNDPNPSSDLILDLIPLPLLTEEGEQTPIGARGWYSSAVLSAMLLSGHETLHKDLQLFQTGTQNKRNKNMMIELGSGALGLGGMTLAWVMAQQKCGPSTKIVMTDYDQDCLKQLEINVEGTRQRLKDYYGGNTEKLPEIEAAHLDWNEFQQQQPLLMQTSDERDSQDSNDSLYSVSFICGAALVYTEATAACADQVAKILRMHPQAVVWVVQWPRNGWFQVFQMQLQQKHHCKIQKFVPARDIHPHIHQLAQTLMPPQICLDIQHIKAVRITSPRKIQ